jgi:hypothetical protein
MPPESYFVVLTRPRHWTLPQRLVQLGFLPSSTFYLKTEAESSFRNVVLQLIIWMIYEVQKNNFTN